jgi:hypothetical protein
MSSLTNVDESTMRDEATRGKRVGTHRFANQVMKESICWLICLADGWASCTVMGALCGSRPARTTSSLGLSMRESGLTGFDARATNTLFLYPPCRVSAVE